MIQLNKPTTKKKTRKSNDICPSEKEVYLEKEEDNPMET